MPGRCQAVFNAHVGADFIEHVLATGLPVLCGEAVGELRTVVSQQFDDPRRRSRCCFCRLAQRAIQQWAGAIDPHAISSLEQAATRSHSKRQAGHPGLNTFHRVFRTMDQESLSYWRRFKGLVGFRPISDLRPILGFPKDELGPKGQSVSSQYGRAGFSRLC